MKTLFPKRKFENFQTSFGRKFSFQISCLLSTVFPVDHFHHVYNAPLFLAKGGLGGNQFAFPRF